MSPTATTTGGARPDARRFRPSLERLEDRLAPAWASLPPARVAPTPQETVNVALTFQGFGALPGGNFQGGSTFVRFVAPRSGVYGFTATTPGSNVDTVLGVFTQLGFRIASNDNADLASGDSYTEAYLQAGRAYYLGISNKVGTRAGSYSWMINWVAPSNPRPVATDFNIDVRFGGGLTAGQQATFQRAADRWAQVILGDVPDAVYNGAVVDDILIEAKGEDIDGPLNILGQAAPDAFRAGSKLPYHGFMEFDKADLAAMEKSGQLFNVIVHEMGHVLGVGTIWDDLKLLAGAGTPGPLFTGVNATREYNRIFRTNSPGVPVESGGGAGTADSHWSEAVFRDELMSGFLNFGRNPVSRITAASMMDLGYQVNLNGGDFFTAPPQRVRAAGASPTFEGILLVYPKHDNLVFTPAVATPEKPAVAVAEPAAQPPTLLFAPGLFGLPRGPKPGRLPLTGLSLDLV
ncbi:MAG: leishmanolysin-related zinc metalloendopeptidase [Gemmataceae bacterium]